MAVIEDYPKHLWSLSGLLIEELPDYLRASSLAPKLLLSAVRHEFWADQKLPVHVANCDYQVSVQRTILPGGATSPWSLWFRAIWWITSPERPVASALAFRKTSVRELPDSLDLAA